ncbi:MAG: hypothetical protein K6A62_04575 [Bacteroidales bacterium]|nr:hypothetical protein [Bacteroidales bacterium]
MEVLDLSSPLVPVPQLHTIFVLVCWNAYCDSRSRISADTEEEALALYEDGRANGIYSSIIDIYTDKVYDAKELAAYRRELFRIERQTCRIFCEDLKLTVAAKALPADRWYEIDPTQAIDPRVRNKLQDLRNSKLNALIKDPCAVVTMPPIPSV